MSIDAITFDLDGTLVDTAAEIAEAVNRTLADFGLAPRPLDEITHLIGNGLHPLMVRLLQRLQVEQPALVGRLFADEVLPVLDRHYAATVGTQAQPYPGVPEALDALLAEGVRLGCVTNKEGRHARRVLEVCGLAGRLELLIAGDTLPEKKPHASVLQQAAQRLGVVPERLAHVGDSRTDIESACNAGAAAWAVPYGYNGGEPIESAAPQRIFPGLAEVAAHVIERRRTPCAN
ncbi:phosphoglycolate phosphatase [uncultured Sphaerotilus sp.]|uniref:phosphoglycolate phosphatase n=1 Tax=uncultured Sphaerotilus sp. TaxID=474984 RepID=UPI0030CA3815